MPQRTARPEPSIQTNLIDQLTSSKALDLTDEYTTDRVDYHVTRLGRALNLSHDGREDLRQDLFVSLCVAARRYDPKRSSPRTFVSRVLSFAAAHKVRCIRNERRSCARSPILLSELQRNGRSFSPLAHHRYEQRSHDLVLDLRTGFSQLDREQQILAEALKKQRPAEIADETGVHRSTVYRNIAAIRDSFDAIGLSPID